MMTRIILFIFFLVLSFNISCSDRQRNVIPFNNAFKMASEVKSGIISYTEEEYNLKERASDCADLYKRGYNKSGVYRVYPVTRVFSMSSMNLGVYCDMTTDGGGWTVIQRRGNFKREDNYFNKNWQEYKTGFGNVKTDFWLGNENIFLLTNQKLYSVRFDLENVDERKYYAQYDKFWIDDESSNYTLHISEFSGTAGNPMEYHDRMKFSTKDRDNDMWPSNHCAAYYGSGWWYNNCHYANLNGNYNNRTHGGIMWYQRRNGENLKTLYFTWSEIKIRPIFF